MCRYMLGKIISYRNFMEILDNKKNLKSDTKLKSPNFTVSI